MDDDTCEMEHCDRGFSSREQDLLRVQYAIQEALISLRQERERIQTMRVPYTYPDFVGSDLRDIKKQFLGITRELQQTREKLVQLDDTVNHSISDGIVKLCQLHRDMQACRNPQVRHYAAQLAAVLCTGFHAEPLEPCFGEPYDSALHERTDITQPGDVILRCKARGWRWNQEVLMRAVVETIERGALG